MAEAYVSSIAVLGDGTFPALAQTKVVHVEHDFEWNIGNASALDCEKLAYFALSVLWRASVSSLYRKLTLGRSTTRRLPSTSLDERRFRRTHGS